MSILYVHLSWFFFSCSMLFFFLLISLYLSYSYSVITFSLPLFTSWFNNMEVSFTMDWMSSWFATVIILITMVITVYSYNYMAPYSKPTYFLWFTMLFVMSMILVVLMSDLFFIMLGWDGLGVVSFFLIVYYQNQSSITSGLFTLLMNRLGDAFFLVTLAIFYITSCGYTNVVLFLLDDMACLFLLLTFMTKSAIYPFSPWLPMAMAAPTPISALVHSSTLVTSGLYLMMRFSLYLYGSSSIMMVMVVLCLFTSFYAGMNTLFERDLKKLIALSTLSHLGFIGLSFSLGLLHLAYFHMLTHALFKSLLFMTMGDIMINLSHSQDIRYLSSGASYTPFSVFIMQVSLLNLLGLPSLSGYFSKDLVLEYMYYSNQSVFMVIVLLINVFFTYYYTYQLYYFSYQSNKLLPYMNFHSPLAIHAMLLFLMAVVGILFGHFYLSSISVDTLYVSVPYVFKIYPISLSSLMFLSLWVFLHQFTLRSKYISAYFSSMMFLSNFMMTLAAKSNFALSASVIKSGEHGLFNYVMNSSLSNFTGLVASRTLGLSSQFPSYIVILSALSVLSVFYL
uniref:NADH:ubiquinone reductase (H(+)-translocating) n=1 Tax=Proales similis TaxID=360698 RepID=A0A7D4WWR8_9BILA|nr:NADH dehydrogenase subunit 5 [Proales similis]